MTEISPRHPDLEVLADIEADDGATVEPGDREHVAGCAECRENLAAITTLRADLAALPEPTMPASVAARIDAALAEAEARTVLPLARKPRSERRFLAHSGLASGVAAGVIALLATVLVVGHYAGDNSNNSTAAPNALERSAQDGSFQVTNSGRTYSKDRDVLVAALPALLAHQDAVATTGGDFAGGNGSAPAAVPGVPNNAESGTATSGGAAAGAARGGKKHRSKADAPAARGPAATSGQVLNSDAATRRAVTTLLQDTEAVRQCAITLTDLSTPPLAVDVGTYDGESVAAFVFSSVDNADEVEFYLVRPTCGPTDIRLYVPHLPRP